MPVDQLFAQAAEATPFGTSPPQRLAMHVHGSWSEGPGSWQAQFTQAAETNVDVLYMTDHDGRATAYKYLVTLNSVNWVRSSTGSLSRQDSTTAAKSFRLLAESAATSSPASVALAIQEKPQAWNRLRTSIAGHSLRHSVSSCALTGGATYEIVIGLSYHPATGDVPQATTSCATGSGHSAPGRSLRTADYEELSPCRSKRLAPP